MLIVETGPLETSVVFFKVGTRGAPRRHETGLLERTRLTIGQSVSKKTRVKVNPSGSEVPNVVHTDNPTSRTL